MNVLWYFFEICIGVAVLLVIAMPEKFFQQKTAKKKRVGASYWGDYQYTRDNPVEEAEHIEVTVHSRKEKIHVGGNAYNSGKSV